MFEAICFTFVVVAMGVPGLILLAWPEVNLEAETAHRRAGYRPRHV